MYCMAKGVKFKAKLHDPKTASREELLYQVQEITKFLVLVAEDFEERLATIYTHSRMLKELIDISKAQREAWNNNDTEKWAALGEACKRLAKRIGKDIIEVISGIDVFVREEEITLKLLSLDEASLQRLEALDIDEYEIEEHEYIGILADAKEKLSQRKDVLEEEIRYEARLIAIHRKLAELIQRQHPLVIRLKHFIEQEKNTLDHLCWNDKQKFVPSEREKRENYFLTLVNNINEKLIQEKIHFYDPFNDLARKYVTPVDRLCQMVAGEPRIDLGDIKRMKETFTSPDEAQMMVGVVKGNPEAFTPEARKYVLEELWVDSKKSMKDIKRKAKHDLMMNIKNRISFDEDIKRIVKEGMSFSLIMLDIDHFKRFNDTYGHDVGDKVLIDVASVLKNVLKKDKDWIYRIGGEEITVILRETPLEGAKKVAENIRKAIERHTVTHGEKELKVTVSAGVVALEDYAGAEALGLDKDRIKKKVIKQSDINLYKAKEAGRNNVQSSIFNPSAAEDNNKQ